MGNRLTSKHARLTWIALGLAGGLALAAFWPSTPLHAVATDRSESFAMATGYLDDDVRGRLLPRLSHGRLARRRAVEAVWQLPRLL